MAIEADTQVLLRHYRTPQNMGNFSEGLPPVAIRGKTGQYTLYEVLGLVGGPIIPGKEALLPKTAEAASHPSGG